MRASNLRIGKRGVLGLFLAILAAGMVAVAAALSRFILSLGRDRFTANRGPSLRADIARSSSHGISGRFALPGRGTPRSIMAAGAGMGEAFWLIRGQSAFLMDPSGARHASFDAGGEIGSMCPDGAGGLFFTLGNRIFHAGPLAEDKRTIAELRAGALPVSLAFDPAGGRLYLADAASRSVLIFDGAGSPIGSLDGKEGGGPGFRIPSPYFPLALSEEGILSVGDPGNHGILRYGRDGSFLSSFYRPGTGPEAFAGCCNPVCIQYLGEDRFLTFEKGLSRLKVIDASGGLIELIATEEEGGSSFLGSQAIMLRDGRVLILDRLAENIIILDRRAG